VNFSLIFISGGSNTGTSSKSDSHKLFTASSPQNNGQSTSSGGASSNGANISQSTNSGNVMAQGGGASGAPVTFAEPVIRRLVDKGYNRHDVLEALTNTNGDEEKASIQLIAKSFKF
jgi:hypothetical protein